MTTNVVFIGLGNMGLPMALNLLRSGVSVIGFDLVSTNVEMLQAAGGKGETDLSTAISAADVVITMLPSSEHVEATYLGSKGRLSDVRPGTLLIDCSTIAPEKARSIAAAAEQQGAIMIDAPVSGGVGGAAGGTLTFMVGGTQEGFALAKPYLEKMGKAIYHAGANGCGQTVKVCNNMLLGIAMVGTAEALNLGVANGMDPKILSEIMIKSSGNNWVLNTCNPCPGVMPAAPASNGYQGGFGVDLMLKDLGLAVENALIKKSSVPLGALARNLFDIHSRAGSGRLDYGSIYKMLGNS